MLHKIRQFIPRRIIRFVITGGINTAVSYLSFVLFISLGIDYLVASTFGYTIAVFNSYFLNKKWTFESKKVTSLKLFVQFTIVNILSLGGNLIIMYILVEAIDVNLYVAQAVAIIFTMVLNYIGYKWVFK